MAERGRTRAFADLLVERQTGQQDSDPYTPVTVEHILDTVNSQRALVLYFSMAAGYLYSWLLAPGAGKGPTFGPWAWRAWHVANPPAEVTLDVCVRSRASRGAVLTHEQGKWEATLYTQWRRYFLLHNA